MTAVVLQIEPMGRDTTLNIRLPADVKEAVKRAAHADFGRSTSAMVVRILREWLSGKGFLESAQELPKAKGKR
jgi:hypothetical protein